MKYLLEKLLTSALAICSGSFAILLDSTVTLTFVEQRYMLGGYTKIEKDVNLTADLSEGFGNIQETVNGYLHSTAFCRMKTSCVIPCEELVGMKSAECCGLHLYWHRLKLHSGRLVRVIIYRFSSILR